MPARQCDCIEHAYCNAQPSWTTFMAWVARGRGRRSINPYLLQYVKPPSALEDCARYRRELPGDKPSGPRDVEPINLAFNYGFPLKKVASAPIFTRAFALQLTL